MSWLTPGHPYSRFFPGVLGNDLARVAKQNMQLWLVQDHDSTLSLGSSGAWVVHHPSVRAPGCPPPSVLGGPTVARSAGVALQEHNKHQHRFPPGLRSGSSLFTSSPCGRILCVLILSPPLPCPKSPLPCSLLIPLLYNVRLLYFSYSFNSRYDYS